MINYAIQTAYIEGFLKAASEKPLVSIEELLSKATGGKKLPGEIPAAEHSIPPILPQPAGPNPIAPMHASDPLEPQAPSLPTPISVVDGQPPVGGSVGPILPAIKQKLMQLGTGVKNHPTGTTIATGGALATGMNLEALRAQHAHYSAESAALKALGGGKPVADTAIRELLSKLKGGVGIGLAGAGLGGLGYMGYQAMQPKHHHHEQPVGLPPEPGGSPEIE